ncbi:hypothetical protein ABEF92_008015 [Exophiala dermatitidis]|uniref:SPIN90/Ldb17 leucine-rich domain-containing protein n=1 Tax=Exophiala dermatitidis (strain ATCC 34100 / CBS 525.76 / NIH/UT8656) TaxID=858893 RepID=H6C1J6_EXODN|nr:uncharacterized protein HMPREF1120_06594 [Exophiala dermatitidis NIH/UT8656]KAJ4545407.1 pre-rRNA processing [Exophiala dermatitidis]EHY58586.1 hypothetical protein HMPREF1120_06594 [Exophiala dermatitidis NIH/UT8656]KAJ4570969.1 pre-rRNA processing [Exophiala dermatitidis]KAJ4571727.1 pre-rRNA processing [Exophiala dermatitidis]KAJ4616292.1 pre-rRNA processing [Exophiala dermatitidis]
MEMLMADLLVPERFLPTDEDLCRCALKLQESPLFETHGDYIRRQFVQCLLEEDEPDTILTSTTFLIADAQTHESTYELLNEEGAFPRLVDLISSPQQHGHEPLHRLLMELLYEMSRIQKIRISDLSHVSDDFVKMLFEIIEQVSDDVNDPYHYPTIRVLLVLNEQYMVAAHDPVNGPNTTPLTNKVIKVLSAHGSEYKTFGENIILLLNREDETSLQLLTLKLLYLLFTTPSTYEYFYTNDLRVLVDILLRNLLDLPEEAVSLRHTYLRVLYPLLEHTQLQYPPHYKRDEIRKVLMVLGGGQIADCNEQENGGLNPWSHFDLVDETTRRLVKRCEGVSWLTDPETEPLTQVISPTDEAASDTSLPASPSKGKPPALPAPRKLKKRHSSKGSTLTVGQYLTPQLEGARQSSLSMMEVAAQREKPGVITPSRNPSLKQNLRAAIMHKKERPPPPPQARRSGWGRPNLRSHATDAKVAKAGITITEQAKPEPEPVSHDVQQQGNQARRSSLGALSDQQKEKATPTHHEPPPVPANHKGHFRKPPPTPKARRWRVKRGKEEDGSNGTNGAREPGKFSSNLPSIVTTTVKGEHFTEQSPFSPHEETFNPGDLASTGTADSNVKLAVSQALENAQAQVVEAVTDTLEHVELDVSKKDNADGGKGANNSELKERTGNTTREDDGHAIDSKQPYEDDDLARTSSNIGNGEHQQPQTQSREDEEVVPFHDAVSKQPEQQQQQQVSEAGRMPSSRSWSRSPHPPRPGPPHDFEITVTSEEYGDGDASLSVPIGKPSTIQTPQMVLTPPAQGPLRGVPGPQYELERSPFLTDEDDDDDEVEVEVGAGREVEVEVEVELHTETEAETEEGDDGGAPLDVRRLEEVNTI